MVCVYIQVNLAQNKYTFSQVMNLALESTQNNLVNCESVQN